MKSTDTPTASKILQQAKDDVAEKHGFSNWASVNNDYLVHHELLDEASLLAMERIAEMSWEKGRDFGEDWQLKESDEYRVITVPDKSTYMNNLFEREQPKQASIYCDCEDYTSIDRNGNCRTCGGEVKE
jgi:hypothetical protein